MARLLLLITLFMSSVCFGQQYTRNGLVAATDTGIMYLGDNVPEWLYFGVEVDTGKDTVKAISVNRGIINGWNEENASGEVLTSFGRSLFLQIPQSFSPENTFNYKNQTNKFRIKYLSAFCYSQTLTDVAISYYYYQNTNGSSNWSARVGLRSAAGNLTNPRIESDRDSTYCTVYNQNFLYKNQIHISDLPSTATIDTTFVSGLNSRATDAHAICWDNDNSRFIIVSDSGIVYSYNKTTLTTLDTLPIYNGTDAFNKVLDVEYTEDGNFYCIYGTVDDGSDTGVFYKTTNFSTYQNTVDGESGNDHGSLVAVGSYIVSVTENGDILRHTFSTSSNAIYEDLPTGRKCFDIDYINN